MRHFDLCVIGSGPGGQKAAIQAAKLGRGVCVVERMESVGGVAIHTGTIPSKALRQAIIEVTRGRDHLTVRGEVRSGQITIEALLASCQRIIVAEMEIVRAQLQRNAVTVITGHARFEDGHRVRITGSRAEEEITADRFLVAVGTAPSRPGDIPFDDEVILTSDDLVKLKRLPRSMIVLGGGVIGTEFASMFARLGVRVTLVEKQQRVLPFLDRQIGEALQYHLRDLGMTLRLGERLDTVAKTRVECTDGERERDDVEVQLASGKTLHAGSLLYCLGRQGATGDLNLEAAGLSADARGRLAVDENYRTANPDVYAVGDVIGFPALASTSMDQGRVAACNMFDVPASSAPQLFPYGIYSIPEISMVGSTEEDLTERGVAYEVGVARYKEIARGQIIGDEVGMLKILFDQGTGRILGVHILGTGATELIHIGQAAMALGGTMDYFANTAFNYPTLAECYKVAALNGLNKAAS
jgi:NAD(P) transhydrogenase